MATLNEDNFFLVIEGLDGSGKTTIARRLAQSLKALRFQVYLTFQPHDPSAAGLFIRQVLTKRKSVSSKTLALAFALNRMDHSATVIEPLLDKGKRKIVICDRYYLSSLVYQSSEELPMDQVMFLNEGVRRPDLTIFLDASTATCFRRMRIRAAVSEEKRDRELFENRLDTIRDKYESAIAFLRAKGEKIEKIDANSDDTSKIIDEIIIKLSEYGRDWLKPQLSLFELKEEPLDAFSLNGDIQTDHRISDLIAMYIEQLLSKLPHSLIDIEETLIDVRNTIDADIWQMPLDDLGSIFLAYVQKYGYTIIDKMPWTDLSAYELEATLPLDLKQRGTVLLLATQYMHDTITNKILNSKLRSVSDFMLVLDPSYSKLANEYSRDLVVHSGQESSLAPAILIFGRKDISDFVFKDMVTEYKKRFNKQINHIPEASDLIASMVNPSLI